MSADVDAAREALLRLFPKRQQSASTREVIDAFARMVRSEVGDEREAAYEEGWTVAEAEYHQKLAAIRAEGLDDVCSPYYERGWKAGHERGRAEGLDVERLGVAFDSHYQAHGHSFELWLNTCIEDIAVEYARLAGADREA